MAEHEATVRIWQVLIAAAHQHETITAATLGALIDVPGDLLNAPLSHLAHCCAANGWPPITALVVNGPAGDDGEPPGETGGPHGSREEVFQHPWFRMTPLTVAVLEE